MTQRVRFDLGQLETFNITVETEVFGFTDSYKFAEMGDVPAGVYSIIFKNRSGKFAKITVIADEGADSGAYGIHSGWYAARMLSPDDAAKYKSSWSILREQPPEPRGPWA